MLAGMTKRRAEGNKQSLVVVLKTYQLMAQVGLGLGLGLGFGLGLGLGLELG